MSLINFFASQASAAVFSTLMDATHSFLQVFKDHSTLKQTLCETGEFFLHHESDYDSFYDSLSLALSEEHMKKLAEDITNTSGFDLEATFQKHMMNLIESYDVSRSDAEIYSRKMLLVFTEQLKTMDPERYEQYYLSDWRNEQEKALRELQDTADSIKRDLANFFDAGMNIQSIDDIDQYLKRSCNISIGIDFFIVDDEQFQAEFQEHRNDDILYIRGRCREETIYCIINELRQNGDHRPVYVVRDQASWNRLQSDPGRGKIFIPFFYASEIPYIEENTNIFVLNEDSPANGKKVLRLRPRTRATLSQCLTQTGRSYEESYKLISDTHGLFIPMKKKLFLGEIETPAWKGVLDPKIQKICLLLGKWEDTEGDRLVIESLYDSNYDAFMQELSPFITGEDPFIYVTGGRSRHVYCLASTEIAWDCLDVAFDDPLWEKFLTVFYEVISESDKLFTLPENERFMAQLNGETPFWSSTIREGMLRTLLLKSLYRKSEVCDRMMDRIVSRILDHVQDAQQWAYIAKYWPDLCEISPVTTLNRLQKELSNSTGLFSLFEQQSSSFLSARNPYIDILWGMEQFLSQKDYFWSGYEVLLQLDNMSYQYVSNRPKDIFQKILCPWYDFSVLTTPEEKILAATKAIQGSSNGWDYVYDAMDIHRSIVLNLSVPKYRDYKEPSDTTTEALRNTTNGYFELLLAHTDDASRWIKMIELSSRVSNSHRTKIFESLKKAVSAYSDHEMMQIKNAIRHLIYKHRFFNSSSWTLEPGAVLQFETLLNEIHPSRPEYEYAHLFNQNGDYPLLDPVPYEEKEERSRNTDKTERLIQSELKKFYNYGYDLRLLAKLCSEQDHSTLGTYLGKYWPLGNWEVQVFQVLIEVQESGFMAIDYLKAVLGGDVSQYPMVINGIKPLNLSSHILSKVYHSEAEITSAIPLIDQAEEAVKKEFWSEPLIWTNGNERWLVTESKKYSDLETYITNLYYANERSPFTEEELYDCLQGIEYLPFTNSSPMLDYYIKSLLNILQNRFIVDDKRCAAIAHIEIMFMNLLEWEDMKCYHSLIKRSPTLYADIIENVFKKDHDAPDTKTNNSQLARNMFAVYEKAEFCPMEQDGKVNEQALEQWIHEFQDQLEMRDQASLFSPLLGRLFSFSPVGEDGYEPCEAIRKMIEKYGDGRMSRDYEIAVFNRRDVFTTTAGVEEQKIAEHYKEIADHLSSNYPKTAQIYRNISRTYQLESAQERKDAEDGWF